MTSSDHPRRTGPADDSDDDYTGARYEDEAMALAGSLNLDSRSFFLNYEMMVAFYRKTEVRWLSDWLEGHIAEARPYRGRPASWWKDILEGMVRAVAYQL